MKTIIHDLEHLDKELFNISDNDVIINANGCSNSCIGCFSCWIKHPKVCIYKVNINGKKHEPKQLKVLDSYSTFLNVAKDRIIYMDINSQYSYIKSINLDGNKEIKLYVVDNTALDTDIQE